MRNTVLITLISAAVLLGGCSLIDAYGPEQDPVFEEISNPYRKTDLGQTQAVDVLVSMPDHGLISQTSNVVACAGQKKGDRFLWMNMVAFDEDTTEAQRKYLFTMDERPMVTIFSKPQTGLQFHSEQIIDPQIADASYADNDYRRLAILRSARANLIQDAQQISNKNKNAWEAAMLARQAMDAAIVQIEQSPVLASQLATENGVEFSHINMNSGKVGMHLEDNTVRIEVRVGSFKEFFGKTPEEMVWLNID